MSIPNHDAQLMAHIEYALDKQEAFYRDVEARTEELLAGDYLPSEPDNIAEAMSEIDLYEIAKVMKSQNTCLFGIMVIEAIKEYWQTKAREKAEKEINAGAGK